MKRLWILLLLCSYSLPTARAQFTHASATAAEDGFNPALTGASDALFLNPGALMPARSVELTFFQTDTHGGGDFLRFDLYNRYLARGKQLNAQETDALLGKWFGNRESLPCPSFLPCFSFIQTWIGNVDTLRTIGAVNQFTPLALTLRVGSGAFGLAFRLRQHSRIRFNRGLLDLLLIGTGEDRTIRLKGEIQTTSFTEIVLGYARSMDEGRLHLGVAPKFILGAQATEASLRSTVHVTPDSIRHTYAYHLRTAGALNDLLQTFSLFDHPQPDEQALQTFGRQLAGLDINGLGLGLNFGVRYLLHPRWHLGLSITDLGLIRWMKQVQNYTPIQSSLTFQGFDLNLQQLRETHENQLGAYMAAQLDSLARSAYGKANRQKRAFFTALPAALHLGIAHTPGGHTALGLAISMGLNNATGNLSRIPLITLSGQTRILLFPLFAGVQTGGGSALNLYGGTGLRLGPLSMLVAVSGTPRSYLLGAGSRFGLMTAAFRLQL